MRITESIAIRRHPEDVFPWISDPERAMRWQPSVAGGEILDETPERVGTTFRERIEEGGKGTELEGEITAYEQNRLIGFHLEGQYNVVNVSFLLESHDGGTRVNYDADVRFKGVTRLVMLAMGPVFKRKIRAQIRSELAELKALCEGADSG